MDLRLTQMDIQDSHSSEISSNSGSDGEYIPPKTDTVSSDEYVETSDAQESNSEDEHQESENDHKNKGMSIGSNRKKLITYSRKYKKKRKKEVSVTVTVKTCKKKEDNKRSWDKKHYCLYCGQPHSKISRHLQRKHTEIKDVAYAFSFPLGSSERKVLLEQLRNKGDFKHNAKVLKKGRGELVTWKQPSEKASPQDYLPCRHCFGMFAKRDLWRHQSSCKCKKMCVADDNVKSRSSVQSSAVRLLPIAASSSGCQNIINNMRQDGVALYIRTDSLICKYGESLYGKHGQVKSRHQYISQRMRELGRFVLVAKDMDKTVICLEDLCAPKKFDLVVSAAKKLTEFSPGKNEYGKPSKAVKIGFCLKGAAEVLIGQTLMNDDDLAEKKAKKFLELLERSWKNIVSVNAHQTIQEKKWNKEDDIPLTKDVMALRNHLRMVEDNAKSELTQCLSLTAYKKLNETVLAQVIVFNKRREGEASRLTLEAYKKASRVPINEDIYETLSPLEKELSKLLTRIEVRGKRGRKVPVFLTERMKNSIDTLNNIRDQAGVPAENPYLFARPGAMTNIRGCDSLRKYAQESKAENPALLRSTKLRKQVATLCQLLDLSEQELEQVARFMGHDIRVHREFYRQTDKTFQIAKISKLLFAMEEGTGTLSGKNLNTIHVSVGDKSHTSTSNRKTRCRDMDEDGGSALNSPTGNLAVSGDDNSSDIGDGGSDLCSPKKKSHGQDDDYMMMGPSDTDDQSPGVNLGKRPLPKKKTGKQLKMMKAGDGGSDLSSPKSKSHCQDDHDDMMMGPSDTDDQSPGVNLGKRPLPKKKTGKQLKMMKAGDGGSDLSSPKSKSHCQDDHDDMMMGPSYIDDEGSDLCSPKSKSHGQDDEDDDGTTDTDDQRLVERHLLKKKKKIGKQSKMVKSKEKKSSAKGKRPWTEPEREAVHKHLGRFIAERRVPGKEHCTMCLTEEKALRQRSWKDVKNFVYNRIVTLNRRSASRQLQL
ncbi:uncharacterized protein LOC113148187 isoform X2 [Anabas testudineus]|uniref:uncharacterized protein LOC113148187 isoform X2 n=1 Tax=Anabas testudineus TaxID=64144 RepID=UPI000E45E80F|nr:uncharacterized protein LOC113148187 isoform X2 [Anabas testudineus]XP_026195543.1 uncharacterized protein LOC113148187 isoform X2 [Anabas testudineus]